ncbi:MAG: DUF2723 domain-containing protein [Prevotella sp.]|nr:DUF2723 domain-containing protein [Prevotella sp.]
MKQFRLVDNIVGWLTFFIAAFVYCSTIEPTASFWDCPEFIDTGYKLQIGHPPGAPFFMLTANLFSQFASDPSQVARMVNTMSALLSATCILFLFWTITHLVRRLLVDNIRTIERVPLPQLIAIEASGLVGALIYTFSDTFWFSAVEGEVYAYSSAFTAVVFWLILKWEDHADEPHADRWLVLIMYMTGLSIGVHLLNLLCLPAIVLVWYYKRYPNANLKGSLVALAVSGVLLAAVLYGVVPGIITVGGWFELLFVNTLGMPFNTGLYIYLLLLVGCVIWAIYETQMATEKNWKRQNIAFLLAFGLLGVPFYGYGWSAVCIGIVVLVAIAYVLFRRYKKEPLVSPRLKNTTLLCMLMLMIGYSTYAVIVIRSDANPPMDQNSPEDIFTLGNYLSRDQYGYRPLLWGQAYSSEYKVADDGRIKMDPGAPIYQRKEKASADEPDRYFIVSTKDKPVYAQNMLFPRMYSNNPRHIEDYKSWLGGIEGTEQPSNYRSGQTVTIPTQMENLRFFFSYQCNFMYWRYFLWNFAGRQNDLQGNGETEKGNWITGFPFIDNMRLGDQSLLPDELKQNKGHNVFYCLPLLLGLIGLLWQALRRGQRGIQQFWVVFFLFFMTGLAIVVYLNQTPEQPRERDYAYAGSFYAYAIWCGMGVAAIIDLLARRIKGGATALAAIVSVACLLVPIQMASQTWDDHDRSDRYCCRDFGQNYLMSLQQDSDPIIYTNGDNDTFPLWYNQDVEGVRTDVRVCNLSYLQTDWYIDQMLRPAYDSPSLPITWSRLEYCSGTNEYVQIDPRLKQEVLGFYEQDADYARKHFGDEPFELKNILKYWVRSTNKDLQVIPTDTIYMTIDKDAVRRSGMMLQGDSIPERMVISLKGMNSVDKSKLMMLEMIANANWERPIYVAMTVGQENYMNLGDNFVQEGLVNRITPFTTNTNGKPVAGMKDFDTQKTYDCVMNHFKFGGANTPGIYLDETVMRMCYTHRRLMVQLAMNLIAEGDTVKAAEVLKRADQELPSENVPHDFQCSSIDMAQAYATVGNMDKAREIIDKLWTKSSQYCNYYLQFDGGGFRSNEQKVRLHFYLMQTMLNVTDMIDEDLSENYMKELMAYMDMFRRKGGSLG